MGSELMKTGTLHFFEDNVLKRGQMSDDSILREKARAVIQAGELPSRRPDRMWGGSGLGLQCTVCGFPVKHDESEIEVEFIHDGAHDTGNYHFHVHCFRILELERDSLERARRSVSPDDHTQLATGAVIAGGGQNKT